MSWVVIHQDPYFVPAILVLLGLVVLLLASVRGRSQSRLRHVLRWGYGIAAVSCLLLGSALAYQRAPLFRAVAWESTSETLLLERPAPYGVLRVAQSEVLTVTEMASTETSISGPRRVHRFQVRTKDGGSYWSAPLYERETTDRARGQLLFATNGRLQRFSVGYGELAE